LAYYTVNKRYEKLTKAGIKWFFHLVGGINRGIILHLHATKAINTIVRHLFAVYIVKKTMPGSWSLIYGRS